MKQLFTFLCTLLFLVYSQSMLVMWCLYFIEQQDIVLYYSDADDTSEGMNYMQTICDSSKGEHDGALSLLKIVQRSLSYVCVLFCLALTFSDSPTSPFNEIPLVFGSPPTRTVFHPPCFE